ncbi:MAG: hypothetical protein HGB35_09430, partial [Geobacteraceae bacterium]|nr:hypothetical protein [Geobacteraceae bacterium]
SAGTAAEHSLIGMLNFSFYDIKRKKVRLKQAGRGGIGTVLRDKKIKGLVAHVKNIGGNRNNVVNLEAIQERGRRFNKEMRELDDKQCKMRQIGTAHLMEIMDDHDLLPTHNYKFGSHKDSPRIDSGVWKSFFTQNIPDGCWIGCNMACSKAVDDFVISTGPYKGHKVIVDGPEYETAAGLGSNGGFFDPRYIIETNFYCDTYGICTITWGTSLAFMQECYEKGILNKERTGGLELSFGNIPPALELLHMVAELENHPSIIVWVLFNEGWGQFDTERLTQRLKALDSSRLVNNASGWTDMRVGDLIDVHSYPGPDSPDPEPRRAAVLGEFGGQGLAVPGHMWKQESWGYKDSPDPESLAKAYAGFMEKLRPLITRGLTAAVYTQTSDVEIEKNGLKQTDLLQ